MQELERRLAAKREIAEAAAPPEAPAPPPPAVTSAPTAPVAAPNTALTNRPFSVQPLADKPAREPDENDESMWSPVGAGSILPCRSQSILPLTR